MWTAVLYCYWLIFFFHLPLHWNAGRKPNGCDFRDCFWISLLLGSHIRHGSMVILRLFLVFLPIILGALLHLLLQPQALYLKSDTNLNIKVSWNPTLIFAIFQIRSPKSKNKLPKVWFVSYASHQSIGYSWILESRIVEYYVIFFCLLFNEKVNFLWVNKKKFSVKTGFEELKKK